MNTERMPFNEFGLLFGTLVATLWGTFGHFVGVVLACFAGLCTPRASRGTLHHFYDGGLVFDAILVQVVFLL